MGEAVGAAGGKAVGHASPLATRAAAGYGRCASGLLPQQGCWCALRALLARTCGAARRRGRWRWSPQRWTRCSSRQQLCGRNLPTTGRWGPAARRLVRGRGRVGGRQAAVRGWDEGGVGACGYPAGKRGSTAAGAAAVRAVAPRPRCAYLALDLQPDARTSDAAACGDCHGSRDGNKHCRLQPRRIAKLRVPWRGAVLRLVRGRPRCGVRRHGEREQQGCSQWRRAQRRRLCAAVRRRAARPTAPCRHAAARHPAGLGGILDYSSDTWGGLDCAARNQCVFRAYWEYGAAA